MMNPYLEKYIRKKYEKYNPFFESINDFHFKEEYEYGPYNEISIEVYENSITGKNAFRFVNHATGAWFYTTNQAIFDLASFKAHKYERLSRQLE